MAIGDVLWPRTGYNREPETRRGRQSAAIFQSVTNGHIESDISKGVSPRRFNLREVIGETRRLAPGKPKIRVYDSEVSILSQVFIRYSRRDILLLLARGLSTWRKRVVHASYTWFMDRGPYSDVPSDTRPMERSE